MEKENVREYLFNKIFFPKVAMIDRPGIIINKTSRKFGGKVSQKRTIFHFEDIFANLQLETISKLGRKQNSEIYYKIGKDLGIRYMILANAKRPSKFLLPFIIKILFEMIKSNGSTVTNNVNFDNNKNSLTLKGSNNIICRKTGDNSFFAGIFSSIFSFLVGENIEAEGYCNCPANCKIIIDPRIKQKYTPKMSNLKLIRNYNQINFPEMKKTINGLDSFKDFMRFKRIKFEKDEKFNFMGKTIIPTEQSMPDFIADHYIKIEREDILKKGIINAAEKLAEDILKESSSKKEKIELMIKMLSALGWGIPYYRKMGEKITFSLLYPPISGYNPIYNALVIKGFLNHIFNKKFRVKEIKVNYNPTIIKIHYT